ncbi:hypothetical protein ACFX13_012245 [Malus domestica]
MNLTVLQVLGMIHRRRLRRASTFFRKVEQILLSMRQLLILFQFFGAVNPFLEPLRLVPEPVLLVPFPGKYFSGAFVGDSEGEDGDCEDDHDEEEHDEEVDPQ